MGIELDINKTFKVLKRTDIEIMFNLLFGKCYFVAGQGTMG